MKKVLLLISLVVVVIGISVWEKKTALHKTFVSPIASVYYGTWAFQSIDTMKYSRDLSRQELTNPSFDQTINLQMKEIESTGATYVAIATPYDKEFVPILTRWVKSARAHHLHVWFRGNFSGWEGWFGYPSITREEHMQLTKQFILSNPQLFADGDVFTACPECENGGPGDPRQTGDVKGFRQFMIDEYAVTKEAFAQIHKSVQSNYDSMNGDVARLVMDKATTQAMDGIVTIDHYVPTGEEMVQNIADLAKQSGGKIVVGEFGAPVPGVETDMTQQEQADWLTHTLTILAASPYVVGVNYWVGTGGSTELWTNNQPRLAVKSLTSFYSAARTSP